MDTCTALWQHAGVVSPPEAQRGHCSSECNTSNALAFFKATMVSFRRSFALYTTPYVPSPSFSVFSYLTVHSDTKQSTPQVCWQPLRRINRSMASLLPIRRHVYSRDHEKKPRRTS